MALLEDRRHVGIHDVSISILITGLVVRVGNVGIVRSAFVRLDDAVGRLYDLQFRIPLTIPVGLFVIHVLCQAEPATQSGMPVVYRSGGGIGTIIVVFPEQPAVILHIDVKDKTLQFTATVQLGLMKTFQHGKPVNARATHEPVASHVTDAIQYQSALCQPGKIFQKQFLYRFRQA